MKNTKLDLMERYLIILDKFVSKISESGVPQQKVIEQSYLFCSGFYIKYKQEIEKIKFMSGRTKLTPARAVEPTNLLINIPSTIV